MGVKLKKLYSSHNGALIDDFWYRLQTVAVGLKPPFFCIGNRGRGKSNKWSSNLSLDVHHFTSHCKMAPLAAGGVVDGDTRMYGTKNVFVADESICPVILEINTAASAMMIGLRSSEILINFSWQLIAGLAYPVFCNTDISLEYRFHQGDSHFSNHAIGFRLEYQCGFFR